MSTQVTNRTISDIKRLQEDSGGGIQELKVNVESSYQKQYHTQFLLDHFVSNLNFLYSQVSKFKVSSFSDFVPTNTQIPNKTGLLSFLNDAFYISLKPTEEEKQVLNTKTFPSLLQFHQDLENQSFQDDYFCYVTFPSIYGQFLSFTNQNAAIRFLTLFGSYIRNGLSDIQQDKAFFLFKTPQDIY
jgi:hypothetical protein